jgi:hypothetical protein
MENLTEARAERPPHHRGGGVVSALPSTWGKESDWPDRARPVHVVAAFVIFLIVGPGAAALFPGLPDVWSIAAGGIAGAGVRAWIALRSRQP